MRKGRRRAAIEAAKRIKKNAEDNAQKYPLYRSDVATADSNMEGQRGRKQKTRDQVYGSMETLNGSSNNMSDSSEPQKSHDMLVKRRGRPPKSKSPKCPSMRRTNAKYKDPRCKEEVGGYDANLRRESYNSFLLNNEPIFQTIFACPKQLHLGNGGIGYRESLMKFTKNLGPTAQKVARRMLQRHGMTDQAQPQLHPLFRSPVSLRRPHLIDLNSVNGSARNATTNQVNQPLHKSVNSNTDAIANNRGKSIMVDDGKSKRNKWDIGDNLEFLFGKQKGGIKIGNDSLDNKNFGNKNQDYAQVGNKRTINQIGSSWSNYNVNLNQNINKISGIEDISSQKEASWNASYGKLNSPVYPATHPSHPRNVSSYNPISWVLQPPMHSPMQPPRNWCLSPSASTMNSLANDSFWKEKELQLALALKMQKKDQESNVRSQNLWAPRGQDRQQPQERLLMPMPPHFWSQMVMSGANPELDALPFGTPQDAGFQMGNHMQHPPPGM
ncbi:hypothetical protein L1987_85945 [Smallanthus sonchifolius]|uniref:Uncharacterized protein n=1 Tax=Smallanthus sonchifolius TaxID=185202 RepID=A0ACB8XZI3_9ASTR|nr:hypothetical protein L1987_85945 [Smallanthus sonchifolius]